MSHDDSAARPGADEEHPDAAGYPDGTGTLDEGTADAAVTTEGDEIEEFALSDEEDLEN
jgi:hypothetical protein